MNTPASPLRTTVALLVYNDAANDSRVLKTAQSLAQHDCDVTILALARSHLGRHRGKEQITENVVIDRVSEFSLYRMFPTAVDYLGRIKRAVQKRQRGNNHASVPAPSRPVTSSVEVSAATETRQAAPTPAPSNPVFAKLKDTGFDLLRRTVTPVAMTTYWISAVRALRTLQPDSIHANDANTLVPAIIGSYLTKAGIVYDSHELWRHRNVRQDRIIAPYLEAIIETAGMRRAKAVITVSPSIARWLRDTYRMQRLPYLVRNVPVAAPLPDRSEGQLRKRAGLSDSAKVIAYGGSITTSRGIEETLEAMQFLPADVHLVLLGYGTEPYLDSLSARAHSLNVTDRVHFVGAVKPYEVTAALADGDVAVVHIRPSVLSYRYALPNKLFESIRAGLPVVAADLPDLAALVRELGVGVAVDGEDPRALAGALADVLANGERYRAAARRVAPVLTWEAEADNLLAAHRDAWKRDSVLAST